MKYTATQLVKFAGCKRAINLDLLLKDGANIEVTPDTGEQALLKELGDLHETRFLNQLVAEGKNVKILEKSNFSRDSLALETELAMEQGYDVIYQGSLIDDEWAGFSDFLVKVDTPSAKWPWSYEVLDTKLKRKEDVSQHLQLVVYSNMIADIQGVYPKQGHIYLGNDTMATVEMSEIREDAEKVMNELKEFIESGEQAPAEKCSSCAMCSYRSHCKAEWKAEDSLFQVAGIRRDQIKKLNANGVYTMEALGKFDGDIPKMAEKTENNL